MNDSKTRPTALIGGAAAEPRDGCEVYYDVAMNGEKSSGLGRLAGRGYKYYQGMQTGLMLAGSGGWDKHSVQPSFDFYSIHAKVLVQLNGGDIVHIAALLLPTPIYPTFMVRLSLHSTIRPRRA